MDLPRAVTLVAVGLFLLEGAALALFPARVQAWLAEADPRSLQLAGLIETIVAFGLAGSLLLE
jgi:hypothetical protein